MKGGYKEFPFWSAPTIGKRRAAPDGTPCIPESCRDRKSRQEIPFSAAHGRATFPFRPLCFRGRIDLPDITDPATPVAAASGNLSLIVELAVPFERPIRSWDRRGTLWRGHRPGDQRHDVRRRVRAGQSADRLPHPVEPLLVRQEGGDLVGQSGEVVAPHGDPLPEEVAAA